MIGSREISFACVALITFAGGLGAQRTARPRDLSLATVAEQRAIERAVIRSMGLTQASLRGYALDTRLYHMSGLQPKWAWDPSPLVIPITLLPVGRNATYAAELARELVVERVINNEAVCPDLMPAACRIGADTGVVAFSPAFVAGDAAQLSFFRWTKGPPGRAYAFIVTFELQKVGGEWHVGRSESGIADFVLSR